VSELHATDPSASALRARALVGPEPAQTQNLVERVALIDHAVTVPPDEASTTPELTTEIVTELAAIAALAPDYEHLYACTGETLPFALQEWQLAWCTHFLKPSRWARERPLFCVLRTRERECVAIVPLVLCRYRFGPLQFTAVSLIGADHGLTEIRNPLIKPGYEQLTVRLVHAHLSTLRNWDLIDWKRIAAPLAAALSREAQPHWYETCDDFVLDLPDSWQVFRAGLKRNIRQSLRHCYNSLRRDGHKFEFVVARTPAEVRAALPRFLQLHAARAAMVGGTHHPDRFAAAVAQEFLYDVCARLAVRDAVRVFPLRIAGVVVASRIGFVAGSSVYLYYSGFDPHWARYSVMTTTVAEALKYAIANGLNSVNLSPTGEQSKLRWRPRLVEFRSALVHRGGLRSRLLCSAYRLAITGSSAPARLLKNLGLPARSWN
jgi:CelD/BcsL family acetyltransferase involved in cellulose biosynthesis